jgi:hypothetical protein
MINVLAAYLRTDYAAPAGRRTSFSRNNRPRVSSSLRSRCTSYRPSCSIFRQVALLTRNLRGYAAAAEAAARALEREDKVDIIVAVARRAAGAQRGPVFQVSGGLIAVLIA